MNEPANIPEPAKDRSCAGLAGGGAEWDAATMHLIHNMALCIQTALERLGAPAETLSAQEDGDLEHICDWLASRPICHAAAPEMLTALQADRLASLYDDPWVSDHAGIVAQMRQLGFESPGHESETAEEFACRLRSNAIAKATGEPANTKL